MDSLFPIILIKFLLWRWIRPILQALLESRCLMQRPLQLVNKYPYSSSSWCCLHVFCWEDQMGFICWIEHPSLSGGWSPLHCPRKPCSFDWMICLSGSIYYLSQCRKVGHSLESPLFWEEIRKSPHHQPNDSRILCLLSTITQLNSCRVKNSE